MINPCRRTEQQVSSPQHACTNMYQQITAMLGGEFRKPQSSKLITCNFEKTHCSNALLESRGRLGRGYELFIGGLCDQTMGVVGGMDPVPEHVGIVGRLILHQHVN